MQLPPAVAGVTLLSFAGGAPDLFTQLAAVCTGHLPSLLSASVTLPLSCRSSSHSVCFTCHLSEQDGLLAGLPAGCLEQ